ncbi:PEP-CTERM sorting domain-containing protein [Colwellia demingiae]|uniref:PEP-CTERM sorting domain-containing protein n=1 Tax=Colwellia demingiae TaxID=89401 RepID=A0A5C6Q777_9GAMM|nr:PEP-CTERM sorting domain-containing protein [Colwellia demingiae]TWX64776.1 PEP-CTERM sorting domain-containing protein [Colwellia demingiae]
MKFNFLKMACAVLILTVSGLANATLILEGGTGSTGAGNIILNGGTSVDVAHSAYFDGATTPASDWVWDLANSDGIANPLDFTFSFSLAGFDVLTAELSGLWGVDNVGSVFLNGNLISSLPDVVTNNFNVLHALSAGPGSSAFVAGLNVLSFNVGNRGGPGAFRASVKVTADVKPIPEPSTLAIFALGMIGLASRRFKRQS